MENQDKLLKTVNGLKKYKELLSDLIKIIEPKSNKLPEGGFISESPVKWIPTIPNEFHKSNEEIEEKKLIEIGFNYGEFPRMLFILNDETTFEMAYAEGKWYGSIIQFDGKIGTDRIYIPKDIKTMGDVELIIKALT